MRPLLTLLVAAAPLPAQVQSQFVDTRGAGFPGFSSVYATTTGDVDGDGDLDFVVVTGASRLSLRLNDGRGRFVEPSGRFITPQQASIRAIALVDIDGDRDLDLLAADHNHPNRVYKNDGRGFFADVTAVALPPQPYPALIHVVGDFDGDGDVDWIVLTGALGFNPYYLNNGSGVFTEVSATHFPATATASFQASAADLDGDGDLDLLLDSFPSALVNAGGGRFSIAPVGFPPIVRPGPRSHVLADFDGDRLTDIMYLASPPRLLINRRNGFFTDASVGLPNALGHIATDVDLDGDVDLLGHQMLHLNSGTGRFLNAGPRAPQSLGEYLDGDFDGDGDPDIAMLGQDGLVLSNVVRHLDAHAPPQLGGNYTVDVRVRPGFLTAPAVVAPFLSFAGAAIPLGSLGTLRLDPTLAIALPLLSVPVPNGRAQFRLAIPSQPSLLGLELHHQALVVEPGFPVTLTNAWMDLIR